MRLLVFTVIFMALVSGLASAETPSTVTRCSSPGHCITVLTGPCGSFLHLQNGVITPMMPDDPRLPANIRGVCGFIDTPYYTPLKPPAPAYCEGPSCIVPLGNYINRP